MNTVERIKQTCKDKGIPISRLERDLNYANGYIGQLRKGTLPADRLVEIANYLDVTQSYLLTGENDTDQPIYYFNEETARMAQSLFENRDLRMLFSAAQDASPDDLKTTYDVLMALKRKESGKDDY